MDQPIFARLRPGHGGCDSPPDCLQEPPFESALPNTETTKKTNPFGLVFFVAITDKIDAAGFKFKTG